MSKAIRVATALVETFEARMARKHAVDDDREPVDVDDVDDDDGKKKKDDDDDVDPKMKSDMAEALACLGVRTPSASNASRPSDTLGFSTIGSTSRKSASARVLDGFARNEGQRHRARVANGADHRASLLELGSSFDRASAIVHEDEQPSTKALSFKIIGG